MASIALLLTGVFGGGFAADEFGEEDAEFVEDDERYGDEGLVYGVEGGGDEGAEDEGHDYPVTSPTGEAGGGDYAEAGEDEHD